MSQILYINILFDWSLSGIMTSKLVIRESESPRPVSSSILISHRCQPPRDSNREVVSQVAEISDISTSIWCKITAPFKIIIQCTSYFSKVGLSLYLYQLKFLINSTLKILYLHINVQINSRRGGYIIILYQNI